MLFTLEQDEPVKGYFIEDYIFVEGEYIKISFTYFILF